MTTEPAALGVPAGLDGHAARGTTSSSALSLVVNAQDDTVVIVVGGELDLSTAPLLTGLVDRVAPAHVQVVIDLAGVVFFCAAGVSALLHAAETVTGGGGRLVLRTPSEATRRILTITDTDRLFDIEYAPAHT